MEADNEYLNPAYFEIDADAERLLFDIREKMKSFYALGFKNGYATAEAAGRSEAITRTLGEANPTH